VKPKRRKADHNPWGRLHTWQKTISVVGAFVLIGWGAHDYVASNESVNNVKKQLWKQVGEIKDRLNQLERKVF